MTDPLPIVPFTKPVAGSVRVPGSKSITNRTLILAAQSNGRLRLEGALFSRDTRIMIAALRSCGFAVSADEATSTIEIEGLGGRIPVGEASIHVGNAGTAARFLTAFLALRENGRYHLDGDEPMRKRPMKGLLDALKALGVRFTFQGATDCFPFTMETQGIAGGSISLDASASSQLLSALLMVAPSAKGPLSITLEGETVSEPFVEMTLAMLRQFGASSQVDKSAASGTRYSLTPQSMAYGSPTYAIEPDATAASYFLALPGIVGGQLALDGLATCSLQGDIDFTKVLESAGWRITKDSATNRLLSQRSAPFQSAHWDFNAISDTFLTLAAIAPLFPVPLTISGIAHTRKQETDRLNAMATELRRLGQTVTETEDSLTITPSLSNLKATAQKALSSGQKITIHTYEDHRVAMSFGILGSFDLFGNGQPWLQIADPACCGKTFPSFFEVLESLRQS